MSREIEDNQYLKHEEIVSFVIKNFEETVIEGNISDLMNFHSRNKFLLAAHSPQIANELGVLIANHKKSEPSKLVDIYEKLLKMALKQSPTPGRHANILQKTLGYFKKDLTHEEKSKVLFMILDYKRGKRSLESVLLSLEAITRKFQKTYLIRQTYFLLYTKVTLRKYHLKNSNSL
jgi:uncharacterized protein YbgA (DUF1722 family)